MITVNAHHGGISPRRRFFHQFVCRCKLADRVTYTARKRVS